MSSSRSARLNELASINGAECYLEIGLHKGITFQDVECRSKVGVDPQLYFDTGQLEDSCEVHEVTSDEYFCSIADPGSKFDLIFLDGLHTFEQTFRDFVSSFHYSTPRTIWVIDDTVPVSWLSAQPSLDKVAKIRHWLRTGDGPWMGDVYKVIFAIHDLFPVLNYATTEDHGQTIVWAERRPDFKPAFAGIRELAGTGFHQLKRQHMPLLQKREWGEVISHLRKVFANEGELVRN